MNAWIVQGIGFIGMALAFAAYQCRQRKRLLLVQILSMMAFTLHFALLGAYTGAMMNLLSAVRQVVFLQRDKKWGNHWIWPALFFVIFLGAGIATWDAWYSFLPVFGSCAATIASWRKKPAEIRWMMGTLSSPPWLVYNILNHSGAGTITEIFSLLSIAITLIRVDLPEYRRKRAEAGKEKKHSVEQ